MFYLYDTRLSLDLNIIFLFYFFVIIKLLDFSDDLGGFGLTGAGFGVVKDSTTKPNAIRLD